MIEKISKSNTELAIIIRSNFKCDDIKFFTPDSYSQQLGYMNRPKGYQIPPHRHNLIERKVTLTQEVLFIKSGKVRVDFYDDDQIYTESRILYKGDVILLATGGHGFEIIEAAEIIEVKQGPFVGDKDKVRFDQVANNKINLI